MFSSKLNFLLPFLLLAFASDSFADVIYALDDGSFEEQNGSNFSGLKSMIGLHRYTVKQNANLITSIQVAWPGAGLVNSDPSKVVLWSDPNLDGNPTDAQVLTSVDTTIQLGGTGKN